MKDKTIISVAFLIIVISGFVFGLLHIREINTDPAAFEIYYNSLYSSQPLSLDLFSLTQRALGKHETRDFEVLKSKNGQLYLRGEIPRMDKESVKNVADQVQLIKSVVDDYGGAFLYVQAPYKNVGQAIDLADYAKDYTEESETCLDNLLKEQGVPVLDLRDYNECCEYYKTDHHWTVQAAFNASKLIGDEIENSYSIDLSKHERNYNLDNYNLVTYDDCFLGSIGIKVGPYFAGRDSFSIYKPKFDTDFDFCHYINHERQFEYAGDFWSTFIDEDILKDSTFNNKYEVNMHGAYVESIIKNKKANNDYKCLLVTHSYGRAMAQYMSLDYNELRYLDPQQGRYNDNILDYINEYQPDVVIYMYNGIVNVGN